LPERVGRYRVERVVGRGATGTVVLATDENGARLALKIGHGAREQHLLADEAELLALAETPGMAGVLDAGLVPGPSGDRAYLALEWVDGQPLQPRSLDAGARTGTALAVARDLGDALASLHGMGLAHGDVKPENVILIGPASAHPRAVLVDLGLSAPADLAVPRGGTPRYLAPETYSTAISGDARARDLWALGLVVAELSSREVAEAAEPLARARSEGRDTDLDTIVRALLAPAPGARPSAEWVSQVARAALGEVEDPAAKVARRQRAVRRAYLFVRRAELLAVGRGRRSEVRVAGTAGAWLESARRLLERVAVLRGATPSDEHDALVDLDALGRARWLTALVGSPAAGWPAPPVSSDSELALRLLESTEHVDPRSLTLDALLAGGSCAPAEAPPDDAVSLAVLLGGAAPSPPVLDAAERIVTRGEHPALGIALARALRLRGQLGRALSVLGRLGTAEALVEAAECARRAGDRKSLGEALAALEGRALSPRARARAIATKARVALDAGDPDLAIALVDDSPRSAATLEVRALAELARGQIDGARHDVDRARVLAENDEERARVEGVAGNVAHAAGEPSRALECFRRAADHASRAGAVLEEATYLTGVAAAGFDAGELAEALEASTRATLLFEHLQRSGDAARALLARAAVFAAAGAATLAMDAADLAIVRARAAGDQRCRAFAHLVHADVRSSNDPDGLEHARRAAGLLAGGAAEDRLRADARSLRRGDAVSVAEQDRLAEDATVAIPARLEWWGARAEALCGEPAPERADRVISALSAIAGVPGPTSSRGAALAAGATLAARTGDGDSARRFAAASAEAARQLARGAPPELRAGIAALPWASRVRSPREASILPEQIADIEALVRALGGRDRLRPLLDQALDALVLWTGVERGLLLLRAPGDRLVPRAARNIARDDLHGVQLALSRSLSERALRTGEPVVAVDAAGELPEVHESVHALKLRSVLAVPLVARGEALGVVYLDDRVRRGAFGPGELAWVRLVAALAAIAISDARDQLALRRAARRARRAEKRLADELSRREAELDVAERELARAREDRATRYAYDSIIGDSSAVRALLSLVDRVTPTEVPVLIAGESGSGKELVARAIHDNGPRGGAPFVGENCGAIPENLLESILFGHVRGAFTGANRPHAGLFEVASGGTLFLDEIGEMSLGMQTKLLRVLEDGEVRPVGSERARKVDVRIMAASHRDLTAMVLDRTFRDDLFYRLNVIRIDVPPLRARAGDIEPLARHFVAKHAEGRSVRLSRAALDALGAYSWPGNIRQLENELRRALVLADEVIQPAHLSRAVQDGARTEAALNDGLNVRLRVDALEIELVRAALERTSGNQTRAAELLGLSRFGLQKMIRRLKIALPSAVALREGAGEVSGVR
jgi:transcriptional regulator with GAF, ATPase, and Fis domain